MKFKVGDKVRVIKNITECSSKDKYVGNVYTIDHVSFTNEHGQAYGINEVYVVYEDELELVEFTKADLKDGMVIEHRDGDMFIVFGDRIVSRDGHWTIGDYNEDLTDHTHNDADVVKVYKTKSGCINDIYDVYDKDYLTLIWERKEEPEYTEMTVAEIEEKLGYKVKVVADK